MTDPSQIQVLISRLDPGLPLPAYAHPGDAGADLYAREDVTLAPGQRALVPTGVAIALPAGYAAFVHPRSGLAARHGITVLNAPGTVDAGYRGEILVNLLNTDPRQAFAITRGDRIAQLVVQPVSEAHFVEVRSLPGSQRGDNGHGASGGFGTKNPSATTSGTSAAAVSEAAVSDSATPAVAAPAAGTSTAATSTAMTPTTKD
jgi:dUTP pyrophosphatase